MSEINQICISDKDQEYICEACNGRPFVSGPALLQHCRQAAVHKGEWCDRCIWLFKSPLAYDKHLSKSKRHCICWVCGSDKFDQKDLARHMANRHLYCYDCNYCFDTLQEHRVESHRRCNSCCHEFGEEKSLVKVRLWSSLNFTYLTSFLKRTGHSSIDKHAATIPTNVTTVHTHSNPSQKYYSISKWVIVLLQTFLSTTLIDGLSTAI